MEPRNQRSGIERSPTLVEGGRGLLFDRLCAESEPTGGNSPGRGLHFLEIRGLIALVIHELRCLLNTRLPVGADRREDRRQTAVDYGLPDFSHLSGSPSDRAQLASLVEKKIEAFEPRLRDVRVLLEPDPSSRRRLVGTVSGSLRVTTLTEPVSFPLMLPLTEGDTVVIDEDASHAG